MNLNKATCQVFRINLEFRLLGLSPSSWHCEQDSEEPTKVKGQMGEKQPSSREIPGQPSSHALGQLAQALKAWGPVHEFGDTLKTPARVAKLWERLKRSKSKMRRPQWQQ